jgi:hypothetical protein
VAPRTPPTKAGDDPVARLRAICLALPEVSERLSHGEPTWFAGAKKTIAMLDDHHHRSEHLAFWAPSPPGVASELIDDDPDQFFKPPYVGPRGWIGVRIDRSPNWDEVAAIVADAYRLVAPKRLVKLLDDTGS